MTTYAFPSIAPASINWQLSSNTQSFQSPWDGSVQTGEKPGARWQADLTFGPLKGADARIMKAFLVSLRGRANRFTMADPSVFSPSGVATGTPLVNGAAQSGASLITDGWTPSTTGILLAGDMIGVNGELKMMRLDADADVGGNATLAIEPPLRASPADNAAITTSYPTATFMLADDNQAKWAVKGGLLHGFTISAIEAFV